MKERDEIVAILESKSVGRTCVYCGKNIRRGYYAEEDLGRKLLFPKFLTRQFTQKENEILIHYRCVEEFIFDMIREGDGEFGGRENTRVLIRY